MVLICSEITVGGGQINPELRVIVVVRGKEILERKASRENKLVCENCVQHSLTGIMVLL